MDKAMVYLWIGLFFGLAMYCLIIVLLDCILRELKKLNARK